MNGRDDPNLTKKNIRTKERFVSKYNERKGGINLFDKMIKGFRKTTNKWIAKRIFYFVDIEIAKCILYRNYFKKLNKNHTQFFDFKLLNFSLAQKLRRGVLMTYQNEAQFIVTRKNPIEFNTTTETTNFSPSL